VQHPLRRPSFLIWVLGAGGRGAEVFFFHELLISFYHVPKLFPKFSMCSPRVFPIAPNIKPICFAQNPPLLTYIAGVFVVSNSPGEKLWWTLLRREISSSQWEVQSCSQGALVFFLLSFGFRVGRLEGRVFFFKLYLVWRVDCKSMQVLLGAAGGAGGDDLFSFQPIGGPKVPFFYSF